MKKNTLLSLTIVFGLALFVLAEVRGLGAVPAATNRKAGMGDLQKLEAWWSIVQQPRTKLTFTARAVGAPGFGDLRQVEAWQAAQQAAVQPSLTRAQANDAVRWEAPSKSYLADPAPALTSAQASQQTAVKEALTSSIIRAEMGELRRVEAAQTAKAAAAREAKASRAYIGMGDLRRIEVAPILPLTGVEVSAQVIRAEMGELRRLEAAQLSLTREAKTSIRPYTGMGDLRRIEDIQVLP